MKHRVLAIALALGLALASGGAPVSATAMHGPAARTVKPGTLLYSASFSSKETAGVPGLHASKGILSADGKHDTSFILPFSIKHVTNFAVQARMRTPGLAQAPDNIVGYGLVVHEADSVDNSGIFAGSFFSSSPTFNEPMLTWNGDSVGGADFQPDTKWHLYRLEVRDTQYRLLIDGKLITAFTIPDYRTLPKIGIFSGFVKIQVEKYRVYALGPAAGSAPAPPVKALNLQPSDVPSGFLQDVGHYFTNAEIARDQSLQVSAVDQQGRRLSYETSFNSNATTGIFYVRGTVVAYTTVDAATSTFQSDETALLKTFQTQQNITNVHQAPVPGIGDAAVISSFDYTLQGQNYRAYFLDFQRGAYRASVAAGFANPSNVQDEAAKMTALATAVDARLRSAQ